MMIEIRVPSLGGWRSTQDGPLHIVFLVHLWFSSWSMLGFWSGNKLLIHDVFFLLCLMWAIHEKREASPVLLALLIDVLSIVLDIIVLSTSFPTKGSSAEKFSAVMAIFNLILRCLSIIVLYRNWIARGTTGDVGISRPVTSPPPSVISGGIAPKHYSTEPSYGYAGSYQNTPALPVPKQELPPIPPSYSQHN